MQLKTDSLKELGMFFGLTLGLTCLVCWGSLVLFKILAVGLSTDSMGPPWAIALFVLGGFVPSLVAIGLTWQRKGHAGLRALWKRTFQFRMGGAWYAAILLVVILGTAGQIAIGRMLGSTVDLSLFLTRIGAALPLIVLGPLSEELGWRGYALDRLQTRWNALAASLILGSIWSLWHLPLWFIIGTGQSGGGCPFLAFLIGTTATSIFYTWLYNNTDRSIWSAVLLHWAYTYAVKVLTLGITRTPLYNWLEPVPYLVMAIAVVIAWGPEGLTRKGARAFRTFEHSHLKGSRNEVR